MRQNKPEQHEARSGRLEGVHTDIVETVRCHNQLLKSTNVAAASIKHGGKYKGAKTQSPNNQNKSCKALNQLDVRRHNTIVNQKQRTVQKKTAQKIFFVPTAHNCPFKKYNYMFGRTTRMTRNVIGAVLG